MAIPVGNVADRVSHRIVFAVILTGMIAALMWTVFIGNSYLARSFMPLNLCQLCTTGFLYNWSGFPRSFIFAVEDTTLQK